MKQEVENLHARVHVHNVGWKILLALRKKYMHLCMRKIKHWLGAHSLCLHGLQVVLCE